MPDTEPGDHLPIPEAANGERHAHTSTEAAAVDLPHRRWPLIALAVAAKLAIIGVLLHLSSAAAISLGVAHVLVLLVLLVFGLAGVIVHRHQRSWPHPGLGHGRR